MFVWLPRRSPQPSTLVSSANLPEGLPSFQPKVATLILTHGEMKSSLEQKRAVVYITVEWACQERNSRLAFIEFVQRIKKDHRNLGITFWVLSEYTEGAAEWFKALNLPGNAATGYGAVVWIEEGKARGLVPYAAETGVESLIQHTLQIWNHS